MFIFLPPLKEADEGLAAFARPNSTAKGCYGRGRCAATMGTLAASAFCIISEEKSRPLSVAGRGGALEKIFQHSAQPNPGCPRAWPAVHVFAEREQ